MGKIQLSMQKRSITQLGIAANDRHQISRLYKCDQAVLGSLSDEWNVDCAKDAGGFRESMKKKTHLPEQRHAERRQQTSQNPVVLLIKDNGAILSCLRRWCTAQAIVPSESIHTGHHLEVLRNVLVAQDCAHSRRMPRG
jgi:hypothetical protein